jgi:hypothetical protein
MLGIYPQAAIFRTNKGSCAAGLVPNCPHKSELVTILRQAEEEFDREFVNPLFREARSVDELMIV